MKAERFVSPFIYGFVKMIMAGQRTPPRNKALLRAY